MAITWLAGRWNLWNQYDPDDEENLDDLVLTSLNSSPSDISIGFEFDGAVFQVSLEGSFPGDASPSFVPGVTTFQELIDQAAERNFKITRSVFIEDGVPHSTLSSDTPVDFEVWDPLYSDLDLLQGFYAGNDRFEGVRSPVLPPNDRNGTDPDFDDNVFGYGGDDTFVGSIGDDRFNGGEGIDTAVFEGPQQNYEITEIFSSIFDPLSGTRS